MSSPVRSPLGAGSLDRSRPRGPARAASGRLDRDGPAPRSPGPGAVAELPSIGELVAHADVLTAGDARAGVLEIREKRNMVGMGRTQRIVVLWVVVVLELISPIPAFLTLGAMWVLLTRPPWFLELVQSLYDDPAKRDAEP